MKRYLKFIVFMLLMTACGTTGEIGNGNTTNVYINSSVSNETATVQLISEDYFIESIETQDEGARIIVTLVKSK